MDTCSDRQRRNYSAASIVLVIIAVLTVLFFVNLPTEELRPVVIGMTGGAVLAHTAIILCRSFWNTVLWFGGFAALIVIATAVIGYRDESAVLTSFVITGGSIIAGFGLLCAKNKTTTTP